MRVARSILALLVAVFGYLAWYSWSFTPESKVWTLAMLISPQLCLAAVITLVLTFFETKVAPDGRIFYNPKNILWRKVTNWSGSGNKISLCGTFWTVVLWTLLAMFLLVALLALGISAYLLLSGKAKFSGHLNPGFLLILAGIVTVFSVAWLKGKKFVENASLQLSLCGFGMLTVFAGLALLKAQEANIAFGAAALFIAKMLGIALAGMVGLFLAICAIHYLLKFAGKAENTLLGQWLVAMKKRACPIFFAEAE